MSDSAQGWYLQAVSIAVQLHNSKEPRQWPVLATQQTPHPCSNSSSSFSAAPEGDGGGCGGRRSTTKRQKRRGTLASRTGCISDKNNLKGEQFCKAFFSSFHLLNKIYTSYHRSDVGLLWETKNNLEERLLMCK